MSTQLENPHGFDPDLFAETVAPLRGEDCDAELRPKTLADLSWSRVLEHVAEHAQSAEGHELVHALRPLSTRGVAERRLAEVAEWSQLLEEEQRPPVYGLRDIRKAVQYAERDGVLIAEDVEAVGRNCDVVARVIRFFQLRCENAPLLAGVASLLDPCEDLRQAVEIAIEPGGRIADGASPDLRRLRRAVQNQTDRLKAAVDRLLSSERFENYLQDDYFTVREDRYVLPVRVAAKNTIPGIVHGYSSSGQTAFVEPQELIDLNNELRWAQIEVEEEEKRILARLSRLVKRYAGALERNTEVLAYLDFTGSVAAFGASVGATTPEFSDDRSMRLHRCLHPLLYLKLQPKHGRSDGRDNPTIPNDVFLDPQKRVLVVSGPNTGGKTVLLKSVGLAALMARCGMPIACAPESKVPFYRSIFTDIGDEQSIERDLSTFSGHLVNIGQFLPRCDERALVLLDELFTGTDPLQGAALAVALLETLADQGSTTIVTTHLEGLKTLALESEVFANAAMGFDIETLEPTYHVTLGIPGSSFALRIADRLGFPELILGRAREVLEGEGRLGVDEALTRLDEQVTQLQKERERLERTREDASRTRDRYVEKYNKLLEREREGVLEETRQLRGRLADVRRLAKDRLKDLKAKEAEQGRKELEAMHEELRIAANVVEEVRQKAAKPQAAPEGLVRVDPADVETGMTVYVAPYKRNADVVELQGDQALVQVGPMKATVALGELYYPSESSRRQHHRGAAAAPPEREEDRDVAVPQTSANTVDLRGLRVDEAIEKLDMFLDAAYLSRQEGVFIIHGHGTGALKRAVRGFLPDSKYVRDFRAGERGEGGDGVTLAYLR